MVVKTAFYVSPEEQFREKLFFQKKDNSYVFFWDWAENSRFFVSKLLRAGENWILRVHENILRKTLFIKLLGISSLLRNLGKKLLVFITNFWRCSQTGYTLRVEGKFLRKEIFPRNHLFFVFFSDIERKVFEPFCRKFFGGGEYKLLITCP